MSSLSLIEAIVLNLPVGKIQALLADHTPEEKKEIVNARDPFGDSPLHLAAARQKEILVHILLDCGADPNAVNDVRQDLADQSHHKLGWKYPTPQSCFGWF